METIIIKSVGTDKTTISAEKVIPATQEVRQEITFDLDFLLKQKVKIQADYNRDASVLATRQKELDDIDKLIADAKALGAQKLNPLKEEK